MVKCVVYAGTTRLLQTDNATRNITVSIRKERGCPMLTYILLNVKCADKDYIGIPDPNADV